LAKQALPQQTTDIFERLVDAKKLIEAATLGDLEKVTILLQQYPEMISGPAWDLDHSYPEHPGWTRAATRRNDDDVAKLLLDFGAVPDHGADSTGTLSSMQCSTALIALSACCMPPAEPVA
jgi:hypothetical protein